MQEKTVVYNHVNFKGKAKPSGVERKEALDPAVDMNKEIYLFVHVPKTAGTSFRTELQQNQSVCMLYDYGKNSIESSPELMNIDPSKLTPDNDIFNADKYNFLCGHVSYRRYAHCVPDSNVISIARNPVERIVSEYQHQKRNAGLACSFEEFYSKPIQQNKQLKLLKGLSVGTEGMVGLTSHYKYFLEIFSAKVALPMGDVLVNHAPASDTDERFNFSPSSIKVAYQINRKDVVSFFKLARSFYEAVKKSGYNTIPPKGTMWNCRIDDEGKCVVGWFSCTENDCYFVVIKVNGEKRVIVSLDQRRNDILNQGLSENPVCGFSYSVALLGAEQGDTVTVGILGSSKFEKTLVVE